MTTDWKRSLLDAIEQELREVTLVTDRYDQGYRDALHWVIEQVGLIDGTNSEANRILAKRFPLKGSVLDGDPRG